MKPTNVLCCWFPSVFVPGWEECNRSSCWWGRDAIHRGMNMPSPGMSDDKFEAYLARQKDRGANAVHLILNNQGDGENARYSIYGASIDWTVDKAVCKLMKRRMLACRRAGMGVFVWFLTDDSGAWNAAVAKDFAQLARDIKSAGLLKYASAVVAILETQDSYNATQLAALIGAIRGVWKGAVGTHEISYRLDHARSADFALYQTSPAKANPEWCCAEARRVAQALGGQPWGYFEYDRQERPDIAEALAALRLPTLKHIGNC